MEIVGGVYPLNFVQENQLFRTKADAGVMDGGQNPEAKSHRPLSRGFRVGDS